MICGKLWVGLLANKAELIASYLTLSQTERHLHLKSFANLYSLHYALLPWFQNCC